MTRTSAGLGIECFYEWHRAADMMAVYYDLGFSGGMQQAMQIWRVTRKPVIYRMLGEGWDKGGK